MSMNMVSFIFMEEVDKVILEVRRVLGSDYSNNYDEEIVLEGLEVETLRINQRPMRQDEMPVSCMPLCMEISLDDDFKNFYG